LSASSISYSVLSTNTNNVIVEEESIYEILDNEFSSLSSSEELIASNNLMGALYFDEGLLKVNTSILETINISQNYLKIINYNFLLLIK